MASPEMTTKTRGKRGGLRMTVEILSVLLLVFSLLLGVSVLLGPRFGWQIDKVLSGSMEPAVKVGGAVVSQKVDPSIVEAGDIITYTSPLTGRLTTHRVVEVKPGLSFQTRGDANQSNDPYLVPARNVVGKVQFHIPYIGYPAQFAKTLWGFIIMIGIPGLIIIVLEMRDVWVELSEDEKRKKAAKEAAEQGTGS